MKTLIGRTLSSQGSVIISDEALGRGGEGSVYAVESHSISGTLRPAEELVAKIYHDPGEGDRGKKIAAMIKSPPDSDSVAWPLAIVFTPDKKFAGYLMRKLSDDSFRQWAELSNTKDRRRVAPTFDFQYALAASRNLAVAIDSIHSAGHVVGDLNESNLFVSSDSTVMVVDTDSAQIFETSGRVFPCLVGKPEYTAAELSHGSLRTQTRTIESDVFAYAVAVFQILTGGSHPTDGVYLKDGEPPTNVEKIRAGVLPTLNPRSSRDFKPAPRIAVQGIPRALRSILESSLSPNPKDRPSLDEFINSIDAILDNLQKCDEVEQHWFDSRDSECGLCSHLRNNQPDPWSMVSAPSSSSYGIKQTSLPSVSFNTSKVSGKARRAPAAVAGQQAANAHAASSGHYPVQNHSQSASQQQSQNYPSQAQQSNSQQYPSAYDDPEVRAALQKLHSQLNGSNNGQTTQSQQSSKSSGVRKHKGKVILDYADGTSRVRPSLGQLFKSNPKVAIYCIKEETPSFARAWWPNSRPVARFLGLIIGLVLSLIGAASWYLLIPMFDQFLPKASFMPTVLQYFSYASIATAALAGVWLFCSAVRDMASAKKQYGSLDNLKREDFWKTSLRFLPLPIIYGPIILLILIIVGISSAIDGIINSK